MHSIHVSAWAELMGLLAGWPDLWKRKYYLYREEFKKKVIPTLSKIRIVIPPETDRVCAYPPYLIPQCFEYDIFASGDCRYGL